MRLSILLAAGSLAACSGERALDAPQPVQFERASADVVQHGKRLATVLGCVGCHGQSLTGKDWSELGFWQLWSANLTRSAIDNDDATLAAMIRRGERQDRELWGMPSHLFTQLTPEDMGAVLAFLRSLPPDGEAHPAPMFEESARQEIEAGALKSAKTDVTEQGEDWPPDAGPGHELARYIVRSTCAECHRMDLRGETPYPGATPRPDLRMVAAYDIRQFARLLRTGKAAGEREVSLMSQVARGRYQHFTDAEIAAVHRYLQKIAETSP